MRLLISGFTGMELEPDDIPAWVGDVVLRNMVVAPKEAKFAFILLPAEGSPSLPPLQQTKLNAPRILQVRKVAIYCASKLSDIAMPLDVHPVYLRRPADASPDPEPSSQAAPRYELELTCNGLAVPFEMSLSSVKKFIWCKSDDVVFHYRVRDALHPAPLPKIEPPK